MKFKKLLLSLLVGTMMIGTVACSKNETTVETEITSIEEDNIEIEIREFKGFYTTLDYVYEPFEVEGKTFTSLVENIDQHRFIPFSSDITIEKNLYDMNEQEEKEVNHIMMIMYYSDFVDELEIEKMVPTKGGCIINIDGTKYRGSQVMYEDDNLAFTILDGKVYGVISLGQIDSTKVLEKIDFKK